MNRKSAFALIVVLSASIYLWTNRRNIRQKLFFGQQQTLTNNTTKKSELLSPTIGGVDIAEKIKSSPVLTKDASLESLNQAMDIERRFRESDYKTNRDALNALGTANINKLLAVSQSATPEEQRRRIKELRGMLNTPQFQKAMSAFKVGVESRKTLSLEAKDRIKTSELVKELEKTSEFKRIPVSSRLNQQKVRKKP